MFLIPNQSLELSILLKDTWRMYHEAEGALWFFYFISQHSRVSFTNIIWVYLLLPSLSLPWLYKQCQCFHISFPNFAGRKTTENIRRGNVNDLYSYWLTIFVFYYLETWLYYNQASCVAVVSDGMRHSSIAPMQSSAEHRSRLSVDQMKQLFPCHTSHTESNIGVNLCLSGYPKMSWS